MAGEAGRCPVCNARWRATALCSRCGADLAPVMRLVARAHGLRGAARDALAAEQPGQALALARAAERLHSTPAGSKLRLLCRILAARGMAASSARRS